MMAIMNQMGNHDIVKNVQATIRDAEYSQEWYRLVSTTRSKNDVNEQIERMLCLHLPLVVVFLPCHQ